MANRNLSDDILGRSSKKKGINSKQKGNANERACAQVFTNWVGIEFKRVPSSGALRWSNHSAVVGDVVCGDERFDFIGVIETKHLQKIPLTGKLRANSKVRNIWESQLLLDVNRLVEPKVPMLLLRENEMAKKEYILFLPEWCSTLLMLHKVDIVAATDWGVVGVESKTFFNAISYEQFYTFTKDYLNK